MSCKYKWLEFFDDAIEHGMCEERAGTLANKKTRSHFESIRSMVQIESADPIDLYERECNENLHELQWRNP